MDKDRGYIIAAIYGSPRRDGNTAVLMDRFLEGVRQRAGQIGVDTDIKKIYTADLEISSCRECGNCSRTGECIIDDDMQDIYQTLIDADFIAVASPVFFTSVSGYLKALIDRCQRFWVLKYEHNKIIKKPGRGIFIGTSGSGSETIFNCPRKVIHSFFDVLFVDYEADFLFKNIDRKGDIFKNKSAFNSVYDFGKKIDLKKDGERKL